MALTHGAIPDSVASASLNKAFVAEYVKAFIAEYAKAFVAEYVKAFVAEYVKAFVAEYVECQGRCCCQLGVDLLLHVATAITI